jgi:hypothetical protein
VVNLLLRPEFFGEDKQMDIVKCSDTFNGSAHVSRNFSIFSPPIAAHLAVDVVAN